MRYLRPADDRYDRMPYRRTGRSGLLLPAISLGLWWNFGHDRPFETSRAIVRRAFDLGITHFDLANNYGPRTAPRRNFGRFMRRDLRPSATSSSSRPRRATTCGPGRTATTGSRKYLLASLDQSLERLGLDYVDIFYSHRFDPDTLEETMGALDTAVRQGKALYVGISSYSAEKTREAAAILRGLGTPLLIHQPSYSMLNRWIEPDLWTRSASSASAASSSPRLPRDADRQVPARDSRGSRAPTGRTRSRPGSSATRRSRRYAR